MESESERSAESRRHGDRSRLRLDDENRTRRMKALFWRSFGAVIVIGVVMWLAGRGMTDASGDDIVDFELAGSDRTQSIMAGWGEPGRAAARRSLLVDYLWLIAYGAALYAACRVAAARCWDAGLRRLAVSGVVVAVLGPIAAALDALENTFLLLQLDDVECGCSGHADIARTFAILKFALIGAVLAWLAAAWALSSIAGRRGSRPTPGRGATIGEAP